MDLDSGTSQINVGSLRNGDCIIIDGCYLCEIHRIEEKYDRERKIKFHIWSRDLFTDKIHKVVYSLDSVVKQPLITTKYYRLLELGYIYCRLIDSDNNIMVVELPAYLRNKIELGSDIGGDFIVKVVSYMGNNRIINIFCSSSYSKMIKSIGDDHRRVSYDYIGLFHALMKGTYYQIKEIIARIDLRDHNYLAYRISENLGEQLLTASMKNKIIKVNWHEKQVFEKELEPLINYSSDIPKTIYYYTRSLF